MVLPTMPTGRANARPMTGSASSGEGAFFVCTVRDSLAELGLLGCPLLTMRG
jgi:hypothetical protein